MRIFCARHPVLITSTPMADVAFLLLVFFILTSVFSANKGITFIYSEDGASGEVEPSLFIRVLPDHTFQADEHRFAIEESSLLWLKNYLGKRLETDPTLPIVLVNHAEIAYGQMISVLDAVKMVENRFSKEKRLGENQGFNIFIPTQSQIKIFNLL